MNELVPEYLLKYKRSPEEILNGRVLPPLFPPGAKRPSRTRESKTMVTRRYQSPEAMQYAIDLYFESLIDEEGRQKKWPTVAGLVLALGFASRSDLNNYADKDGFKFIIDRVMTRIESYKNDLLLQGGSTTQAARFDLIYNHGWKEKVEHDVNVSSGSLAELVQALQGKVLRPVITLQEDEDIEDAEYVDEAEEAGERLPQQLSSDEYAEEGEIIDDIEDLI